MRLNRSESLAIAEDCQNGNGYMSTLPELREALATLESVRWTEPVVLAQMLIRDEINARTLTRSDVVHVLRPDTTRDEVSRYTGHAHTCHAYVTVDESDCTCGGRS